MCVRYAVDRYIHAVGQKALATSLRRSSDLRVLGNRLTFPPMTIVFYTSHLLSSHFSRAPSQ